MSNVNVSTKGTLTKGELMEAWKGLPLDTIIAIERDYKNDYEERRHVNTVYNDGKALILFGRDDFLSHDQFPTWLSNILDTAESNGACEERITVARQIVKAGATEDKVIPAVVRMCQEHVQEFLAFGDLPEAWAKAFFPEYGATKFIYVRDSGQRRTSWGSDAETRKDYFIIVNGQEVNIGVGDVSDIANIGEEMDYENANGIESKFVVGGVLPYDLKEKFETA